MFEVTPDDIAQLNDTDLRELVGRLCEAELARRGLSTAAVTWGGDQNAPDGGIDVRVDLSADTSVDGYIPRASTGFQVKKPDLARAAILAEMKPNGAIRPAIRALADECGAYVIVSSRSSTSDNTLRHRRNAMREALGEINNASQLQVDFYDRTRLATWVRDHPGLIAWVRQKVGRAIAGWRPHGAWTGAAEGVDAEYLLDDKLRLHLNRRRDEPARAITEAIDELRDQLTQPRRMVRLVGLSGVGKTRLAQALFDTRIGSRPLLPSLAVYTDLSDNPDPQPIALASDLIANRTRAVLIVDNCPPDLHRRLAELCTGSDSTISVLTIEYDVRDDQPEETQVVTLDTSSPQLIEKLLQRRFPHLSQVNARTIAEAAGGNARIAIAIAGTVEQSETVAGLSDDTLFRRLFHQRHEPDQALFRAAQACSLVYSFQGEKISGDEAELPRLAALADQTPGELYRHVSELARRDLVQTRSVWRAVLPHAIANWLAARALDDLPHELIEQQLITGGAERLARSFSRRLSFLHEHPRATAIAEQWLAPEGLLADVTKLNDLGRAMFENIAPVSPEATLSALERAASNDSKVGLTALGQYRSLLRSLAYDQALFDRSASLLMLVATQSPHAQQVKEFQDTFSSLFTIYLSGTHATIEQRLSVLERMLRSDDTKQQSLGLAALHEILKTTHFSSTYSFEFGARTRDYGYQPRNDEDINRWYGAALRLIERLAFTDGLLKSKLANLLAQNFRGLWSSAHLFDELESISCQFAAEGFWRAGWVACRKTMRFDRSKLTEDSFSRLSALEAELKPSNLRDRVQAMVLGDRWSDFVLDAINPEDDSSRTFEKLESTATALGTVVAADEAAFSELLPELLRGGTMVCSFGYGLATASKYHHATWSKLVEGLERLPSEQRNVGLLQGYIAALSERDRELAQDFLDAALEQPALAEFVPALHPPILLDTRGAERIKRALRSGTVPVRMFQSLALGRRADQLTGRDLKDLVLLIAEQPNGFDVALDILFMRLFSNQSDHRPNEPELLDAGRDLMQKVQFKRDNESDNYRLAEIVRVCLTAPEAAPIAAGLVSRLRQAIETYETSSFYHVDLTKALLEVHPAAVLDALFDGYEAMQEAGVLVFNLIEDQANPADAISCNDLIVWCDQDPTTRFMTAASFITFARRSEEDGSQIWSEQAKALLTHAPNPGSVLEVFIKRFHPMSWSGSRATLIETNARLLDNLENEIKAKVAPIIAIARNKLAEAVEYERERETVSSRASDERFE